jgi:hypothetical protein
VPGRVAWPFVPVSRVTGGTISCLPDPSCFRPGLQPSPQLPPQPNLVQTATTAHPWKGEGISIGLVYTSMARTWFKLTYLSMSSGKARNFIARLGIESIWQGSGH